MNNPRQADDERILPILLSVVVTVQDEATTLERRILEIGGIISSLVSDYELVLVDNGSTDQTLSKLHRLATDQDVPNLQVFSLAERVDNHTARWVGIENCLGDQVVCLDWHQDDPVFLEGIVRKAAEGFDLVFTRTSAQINEKKSAKLLLYHTFGAVARRGMGITLDTYSPTFIAISRRIVNYVLQFPDPQIKFRNIASTSGFKRTCIVLPAASSRTPAIKLRQSVLRGIKLVTASSSLPLRMATLLAATGALVSLLSSFYVVLIWIFKKDVAPGWVSLSMQQSVMFFLISMVLLVLSEYVLEISRRSSSGPPYYIADEFTSTRLTRKQRLNIEFDRKTTPNNRRFRQSDE
jgi:hypothetical protein